MRRLFLSFIAVIAFLPSACSAGDDAALAKIVAVNAAGERHVLSVEIAATGEEKINGLMFRKEMAEDRGMLFMFNEEAERSFWMRNTLIPLDMIFLSSGGVIRHIHRNAVPLDETPVPSLAPVSRVLELNGGAADRLGLKEGDILYSEPYFGNKLAE